MKSEHAKQQTLLLLLLAFVLLAGAALFLLTEQQKREEQASSEAAEGSITLSSVRAEDLRQIELSYQGQTLTLDYADGNWTLAEDPAYHLDTTACNTMLTALTDLRAKREIIAGAGEDYGLSDPQVTVRVTTEDGTEGYAFGSENPVTGDLYLTKEGEDRIYTVSETKAACFEKTKADLFGAFNPAGLTSSEIEAVTLVYPDGRTVALAAYSEPVDADSSSETDPDGTTYETVWKDREDPSAALDPASVQSLLSALSGYVTGQITDADPAAYHLRTLVTVEVTAGERSCTLTYSEGTDSYYLSAAGDDSLYTVDESILEAFRNFGE